MHSLRKYSQHGWFLSSSRPGSFPILPYTSCSKTLQSKETGRHGHPEHPGVHGAGEGAGSAADAPKVSGRVGAVVGHGTVGAQRVAVVRVDDAIAVDVAHEVGGVIYTVPFCRGGTFVEQEGEPCRRELAQRGQVLHSLNGAPVEGEDIKGTRSGTTRYSK